LEFVHEYSSQGLQFHFLFLFVVRHTARAAVLRAKTILADHFVLFLSCNTFDANCPTGDSTTGIGSHSGAQCNLAYSAPQIVPNPGCHWPDANQTSKQHFSWLIGSKHAASVRPSKSGD
jgi:hypothetical protein